ncbi:Zn(II)2Cys6 transcription factor domain-containing protein [Aspergillus puulaauensis]|uniref:Zn(2)-C6 fungal-type domain-containing protein n=1 Tax=Aspergillus puulaauensis TaxID=1220207 RepID=A0A7R7XVB3_9EURO|nr:uncharacterized protein APUU_61458A [Aspergillus puulaauensis]BCS28410.1 hypothetical protein APUU_61458A [Aspergillus puulaauensis]
MCDATAARPRNDQLDGKPGRLRAACTNCHAAKVRCSGERTGCTRCRTLNQDCVYLESRVGKTRGRRKQHFLSPTAVDLNNRPMTATSSHEEASRHMGESSAVPGLSPASSSGDADFLNNDIWDVSQSIPDSVMLDGVTDLSGVDFFQQFSQKEMTESTLGESWGNIQEERPDSAPRRLDSAIEMPDEDTTPTMRPSTSKTADETVKTSIHGLNSFPPRFTQQRGLAARMGPCSDAPQHGHKGVVVVAAEILESLEGKICAGLSAIDEVLRINKEATQKINQLLRRSDYARSMGSLMVVVAAAHHVVCLFETACDEFYASPCRGRWSLPSTTDSARSHSRFGTHHRGSLGGGRSVSGALNPPGIGFGTFLLDPQDQAAMGARIICTELHRTLKMVQSLSTPMQAGCFAPDLAPVAVDGWLQDLKQRLRTLISTVESSERSWDG